MYRTYFYVPAVNDVYIAIVFIPSGTFCENFTNCSDDFDNFLHPVFCQHDKG